MPCISYVLRVWRCYAFSCVLHGFIFFCGRIYQNTKIMR